MTQTFSRHDDQYDSRDLVEWLEEYRDRKQAAEDGEEGYTWDDDDQEELDFLEGMEEAFSGCEDWHHGAQIISDDYFEEHIKQLIEDCYEMPKMEGWPFCHLEMDWGAAAEAAKVDYFSETVQGTEYYAR